LGENCNTEPISAPVTQHFAAKSNVRLMMIGLYKGEKVGCAQLSFVQQHRSSLPSFFGLSSDSSLSLSLSSILSSNFYVEY